MTKFYTMGMYVPAKDMVHVIHGVEIIILLLHSKDYEE